MNGLATGTVWQSFYCISSMRKIGMIYITPIISTVLLSSVITTISVLLLWGNHDKWRSLILPQVWRSACFPFIITSPIFGHNLEPHYCQWWQRWYWEFAQSPKLLLRTYFSSLLLLLTCGCLMFFIFTYLNMSLPAGVHESPSTCITCVCLMVDIPFSSVHHASNMLIMHVHITFSLLFKPVVSCSISLASH
jgi:hypothetical protein